MTRTTFLAATAALALALVACGDDAKQPAATTPATTPAASTPQASTPQASTPQASTPRATAPAPAPTPATGPAGSEAELPTKIVSLSPSSTETLFAIGAGPQVLAVDEYSNFPAATQSIKHDLSGYTPNVEAIAALKPDLVIHDGTTKLHEQLAALQIRDLVAAAPVDLSGVYTQIEQIGAATGHVGEAAELVSTMTTEITAAIAKASTAAGGTRFFHEVDNTLYSTTSKSFIGQVYAQFGLVNIADAAGGDSPYPQLSAETIISADPQLIFLADGNFGESAATVAKRPGWAAITAVKNGNIVVLDADIASRWGPRVVDFVTLIADAVAKIPVGA
jgi:iron complex transport system substrate-binding protein